MTVFGFHGRSVRGFDLSAFLLEELHLLAKEVEFDVQFRFKGQALCFGDQLRPEQLLVGISSAGLQSGERLFQLGQKVGLTVAPLLSEGQKVVLQGFKLLFGLP